MKFLRAFLLIPAALVVVGVRLLDLFGVNIKFSNFFSTRIGHLVGNTEIYLCERDLGLHKGIHIWTHYGEVCNEQIALMWARVMRVWPSHFTALVILINKMFPGWEKHEIGTNTMDRDPADVLQKCRPHLQFTAEERERGEAQLQEWGLGPGDQWVCLMVRDAAYLPMLDYHAYRDCDVDNYEKAALELANRGYYVFRMGKRVAKPFAAKHPRIIDFATNGMHSDFMSVYLGAFCAFCITTSTGWDAIPQAFRRPMCYTNFVPFEYIPTWLPNSLVIWKHHRKGDKRMSATEIFSSGAGKFMAAGEFMRDEITLEENTQDEILAVVCEMADMLEGKCLPGPQTEFWEKFPISFAMNEPLHGVIRIRIGAKFLKERHAERQEDSGGSAGARRLEARTA